MNIVLTYDPRWGYSPEDQIPFWSRLETVDYVVGLLEEAGNTVLPIKADGSLEFNLREIMHKHPESLVFWLNSFMPTDSGLSTTIRYPVASDNNLTRNLRCRERKTGF